MAEVYEYDGCKAIVDCENMTVTIQDGNGRSLRVFSGFRYSDDIDSFLHFGDFGPLVCNEFMTVTRPTFKLECEEEA